METFVSMNAAEFPFSTWLLGRWGGGKRWKKIQFFFFLASLGHKENWEVSFPSKALTGSLCPALLNLWELGWELRQEIPAHLGISGEDFCDFTQVRGAKAGKEKE